MWTKTTEFTLLFTKLPNLILPCKKISNFFEIHILRWTGFLMIPLTSLYDEYIYNSSLRWWVGSTIFFWYQRVPSMNYLIEGKLKMTKQCGLAKAENIVHKVFSTDFCNRKLDKTKTNSKSKSIKTYRRTKETTMIVLSKKYIGL